MSALDRPTEDEFYDSHYEESHDQMQQEQDRDRWQEQDRKMAKVTRLEWIEQGVWLAKYLHAAGFGSFAQTLHRLLADYARNLDNMDPLDERIN